MAVWWISWHSKLPLAEFELHSPWWVTGYDSDDYPICCAAVRTEDEEAAWEKIRTSYDNPPDALVERFCNERDEEDFNPFASSRFPKSAWMAWTGTATCACDLDTCDGKNL